MNHNLPGEIRQQIIEALHQGRKIEAVKWYRQATATSLFDAKTAVDHMEAELKTAAPERFKTPDIPPLIGCTWGMAVLLLGVVGGLMLWADHSGDAAARSRFSTAMTSVFLVVISMQVCIQSLNKRKIYAYLCLAILIVLLSSVICRAFSY